MDKDTKTKDAKQDKQIQNLKKQLKEIMAKYLKKRKKETKDKTKYKKIKSTIQKKSKKATTKSELTKLIELLRQGTVSKGASGAIVPQVPAVTAGSISDRVSKDTTKTKDTDPIKAWRDLRDNWKNVKDKYNNDTLTSTDIENIYSKAILFSSAVGGTALVSYNVLKKAYGTGKKAYEYLMRFLNKNRPPMENPVAPPPPPPSGGGGGGGGGDGGDDGGDSGDAMSGVADEALRNVLNPERSREEVKLDIPLQPPPSYEDSMTGLGEEALQNVQMRGQGLGTQTNQRLPEQQPIKQSWSQYMLGSLPSTLMMTGLGIGVGALGNQIFRNAPQKQMERQMERQQPQSEQSRITDEAEAQLLRSIADVESFDTRLRERGREQDIRGVFGEALRDSQVMPDVGVVADGAGIGGYQEPDEGLRQPQALRQRPRHKSDTFKDRLARKEAEAFLEGDAQGQREFQEMIRDNEERREQERRESVEGIASSEETTDPYVTEGGEFEEEL